MRSSKIIATIALCAIIFAQACKKDNPAPAPSTPSTNNTVKASPKYDTLAPHDEANAFFIMSDVKNIADGAAKNEAVDRMLSGCESYRKFDTVIGSQTDTAFDIFFGNTDCTCTDGRTRRGHIFVMWNGKPYFDSASVITVTFKNYFISDIGVAGTRILANVSSLVYSFNASITLSYPNGKVATWNASRLFTQTTIGSINYYSVTGSASGVSEMDSTFSVTITSPYYITVLPWWLGGCTWVETGSATVVVSSSPYPEYLHYGVIGACSNQASFTVNSYTYLITLP